MPRRRAHDGRLPRAVRAKEAEHLLVTDLEEIGAVRPLAEAPAAFTPDRRVPGKTIIRVTEGG
jgi:hypothetical protein